MTGNGNAHPGKQTTRCIGTVKYEAASDFFGTSPFSLPDGVGATDDITVTDIINVILKP